MPQYNLAVPETSDAQIAAGLCSAAIHNMTEGRVSRHHLILTIGFGTMFTAFAAARGGDLPRVIAGVGIFDVARDGETEGRVEFRLGRSFLIFNPMVGVLGTASGATYGYAGLNFDVNLPGPYDFALNSAVGAYHRGDGRNLGGVIEFRSGIEFHYSMLKFVGLGVGYHHISNASLYKRNPGANSLSFFLKLGG